jgi:hypothetical protein
MQKKKGKKKTRTLPAALSTNRLNKRKSRAARW